MANEVTVATYYQFQTDDGTLYSDEVSEIPDAGVDVSQPHRYQAPVGTAYETILDLSTSTGFAQGQQGNNEFYQIINRDDSNAVTLRIQGTGTAIVYLSISPNEWHYIRAKNIAVGTGVSPTFEDISQIDAKFDNAAGTIELLTYVSA